MTHKAREDFLWCASLAQMHQNSPKQLRNGHLGMQSTHGLLTVRGRSRNNLPKSRTQSRTLPGTGQVVETNLNEIEVNAI